MSTLEEAKSAIESEIAQIEARLALLKISLEHLDAAIQQPDIRRQTVVAGHGAKPIKAAPAISARTAKNHKPLPKTGESFWLQFLSQEPKLSGDLFSPALASLSIKPTSDNAKILRQRLSVILSTMAKKGVIKAIGTGRSKHYAKA